LFHRTTIHNFSKKSPGAGSPDQGEVGGGGVSSNKAAEMRISPGSEMRSLNDFEFYAETWNFLRSTILKRNIMHG